jgi:ABC-type transport system substrate-binding protein
MWKVIEPPFQYHFLKRPYELDPLTAREVPRPQKEKVTFQGKDHDATVYTVRIRPGIRYQNHPCFVEANRRLTEAKARHVETLWDLKATASRELEAGDYVHAVRRLADPRLACPIFATLSKNMLGMAEYQEEIERKLEEARKKRRAAAGALYNQEQDEKHNPIRLDYAAGAERFPFIQQVDRYTFQVALKRPYPQMLYWMAMTFFAPVPPEAIAFFDQPAIRRRSILFDRSPVGTGPFELREYDPTNQMVFARNANYRLELYPTLPRPGAGEVKALEHYEKMKAAGMLDSVGKRLPMIDRIVYRMEKESIPRWNKFLQGYYDGSGIGSDQFDQAVTLTSQGESTLTDELADRGIRLLTADPISVSYCAFNMADGVIGGYTDKKRKLRQAISIAFSIEDEISIFANGRGVPAHSPIPPGIFGHEEGQGGINPVVYRWDPNSRRAVRRSLDEAKRLLAEAGYANGYGPDGQRLSLRFATSANSPEAQTWLRFIRKQFDKLNIRLVPELTDYNRFQDKVRSGNFQFLRWGWLADYPDPENFLFLLYGPNGKVASKGENVANYRNEEYDGLFAQMENMENTPERLKIIRRMLAILRADAPWVFGSHPVSYILYHKWCRNAYPHALANNRTKYQRINTAERTAYRRKHNKSHWGPVVAFFVLLVLAAVPAVWLAARHLREV